VLALLSLLPLGVAAAALLLTASRGAWLGLAAGVGAAAIGWIVLRRAGAGSRARRGWAVGLLLALGLSSAALFALAVTQPQLVRWLGSVGGGVSTSRPDLWRDMLALVRDYPWTGSGLGSTLMVDATYVRLLHVGFIYHAHNLFLQVAIEQGVPGLVFFVAILALAAYRLLVRATPGILALAALAALVVLVVNGLVDAGLYASRLAPLLFAVPGFALAVAAAPGPLPAAQAEDVLVSRRWLWGIPAAVLLVVAVLLVLPGSRATGLANLGAVAQSRAELAVYRWPDVGIQDELRRLELVDLAPAIGYYQAALALDPNNVTANRRLGQIGLSMGDQAVAREHLERAYAAAPGERATRQLLAEVYAVAGEVERARDLWDSVDTAQGQLDGRIWWYENLGNVEASRRLQALRR
jgi:tetratricopeptide (TPR) repeat protein